MPKRITKNFEKHSKIKVLFSSKAKLKHFHGSAKDK